MNTVRRYHNAEAVLPPGLLAEVQRYVSGRLWVPAPAPRASQVRHRVVSLAHAGVATRDIAALVQISQRRVQQIIRTAKQGASVHAE